MVATILTRYFAVAVSFTTTYLTVQLHPVIILIACKDLKFALNVQE